MLVTSNRHVCFYFFFIFAFLKVMTNSFTVFLTVISPVTKKSVCFWTRYSLWSSTAPVTFVLSSTPLLYATVLYTSQDTDLNVHCQFICNVFALMLVLLSNCHFFFPCSLSFTIIIIIVVIILPLNSNCHLVKLNTHTHWTMNHCVIFFLKFCSASNKMLVKIVIVFRLWCTKHWIPFKPVRSHQYNPFCYTYISYICTFSKLHKRHFASQGKTYIWWYGLLKSLWLLFFSCTSVFSKRAEVLVAPSLAFTQG